MKIERIDGYKSFCTEIKKIGFCLSGDNGEGIFSLRDYYSEQIDYHTGIEELDPWQWRIRAIQEDDTISYGKVFFNKSGWITSEWLPSLICLRRKGQTINALYQDGLITQMEKNVYDYVSDHTQASLVDLQVEFGRSNKSKIVKALTNLQMKILLTTWGETYKISKKGEPYGWPVTVFCTVDEKFGEEVTDMAFDMNVDDAYQKLSEHIKALNPLAEEKRIKAFLKRMV